MFLRNFIICQGIKAKPTKAPISLPTTIPAIPTIIKNINKTKDQNSILSLYRDAKPLIEININNHVLNKLAEEDFTESEDRILYREEVEEFLELADTVYKSVKEHFADKKQ